MNFALKVTDLKKKYGKKMALDGLNMTVPQNTVYGFLGENGAGKTTTFSILGGFIYPSSGSFTINGKMSMLPQDARFGVRRKIGSQLKLLAKLSGVSRAELSEEVKRVLKTVGMEAYENLPVHQCSHGMYKRVGIAQALLGNPDLLLFDEPTAGLDPKNAHDIRQLISALNHNKTVVVSSHNLAEIEQMCEYVGIINQGKMVYEGQVKELVGQNSILNVELTKKPDLDPLKKIQGMKNVEWREGENICQFSFEQKKVSLEMMNQTILEALFKQKIGVRSLNTGTSLEQEYLKQLQNS